MTKCIHCQATVLSTSQPIDANDLVSRLDDQGLFNKAERIAMLKEARDEIVRLRAALAATPAVGGEAWPLTREDMEKLHGQAHGGAMLGGDNAYQACLAIKGILARIAAQPTSPLRGTCIECGKCDPCDDDCPNYQDQEPSPNDREIRTVVHLLQMAKSLGWPDDGEGALEFMLRRAREVAFQDCAAPPEQPAAGCGDPNCKDPNCDYGKGPNVCGPPAAAPVTGQPIREDNYMSNDLDREPIKTLGNRHDD